MKLPNSIYLTLSQRRSFWAFIARTKKIIFIVHREIISSRAHIQEGKISSILLIHLAKNSITKIILCSILALGAVLLDPYIRLIIAKVGITLNLSTATYDTLLGTVSAIGGVLIGLYYAAITSVVSSIYSKVPNNLRDLMSHERLGTAYMNFLVILTLMGLIFICLRALGSPILIVAIPLLLFMAAIALASFIYLGARAFNLFDPTSLTGHIFAQLDRNLKNVISGNYRSSDPSFQQFAYRQAKSAVSTLHTVSELCKAEPQLSGQPYTQLASSVLIFLSSYQSKKAKIPTESYWYGSKYAHIDWYKTGDTTTSLLSEAAWTPEPERTGDKYWLERECIPIVINCLEININESRHELYLELMDHLNMLVKYVSIELRTGLAIDEIRSVAQAAVPIVVERESSLESIYGLALIDRLMSLPTQILLGFTDSIKKKYSPSAIRKAISSIKWSHNDGIYHPNLPLAAIERLEWLAPRIEFEFLIEGRQCSPLWYIEELTFQAHCEKLKENIQALYGKTSDFFDAWYEFLDERGAHWLAGVLLSRENEYWTKVRVHRDKWKCVWKELEASRKLEGLSWPADEFESQEVALNARWDVVLNRMSAQCAALVAVDRQDEYPDLPGQFLHLIGENIFDSVDNNSSKLVESLFSSFLQSSFKMFFKLLPKNSGRQEFQLQEAKIAAAPILDLMDLSGYASFYAEYFDNHNVLAPVIHAWEQYLSGLGDRSVGALQLLASCISVTEGAFEIPHRGLLRTRWQQRASGRVSVLTTVPVDVDSIFGLETVEHKSPLIKALGAGALGIDYTGIDIFVATFLRSLPEAVEIDFGRSGNELAAKLAKKNAE